ncbi:hypothetical protein GYMLUDRAFT_163033 [Collybiopsis luxurians FD-317 M1]|uniref:L-lysine 6-oxidase n=1 Tax=Collybiopsis luxurians FD-317 M1 TaxID=944289 RepID=A0A0D0CKL9_9AGAR|nr:hypothetical protein GYMLUDRAFT_163033 [Collybiopsis luxurians FD-317 M1]
MVFEPIDPSKSKTYLDIKASDIHHIEIFPPIGIARVGDAKEEYYYAPEVPGLDDHPFGNFRDEKGGIKRQAVRFRVYAYDNTGKILGEINKSNGYTLSWTVHVANKKAAFYIFRGTHAEHAFDRGLETRRKLIIDPGPKTISGGTEPVPLKGSFEGSMGKAEVVQLGELRTDKEGRLVFLGGDGSSHTVRLPLPKAAEAEIISEFDSVDWYDNMCDGYVKVEVTSAQSSNIRIESSEATVISAPPKFAWGIESPTSLYDILDNIYNKSDTSNPNFYKDIWPVISGTYKLSWVNEKAFQGHGTGAYGNFLNRETELSDPSAEYASLREYIFDRLRQPNFKNENQALPKFMPRLSGDNGDAIEPGGDTKVEGEPIQRFAALTELQYSRFKKWKDGNFEKGDPLDKTKKAIEDYDKTVQPMMLTRAILEQAVGNPLFPGIEMFWIAKVEQTYITDISNRQHLHPPFRVNHKKVLPGFLTRGLSIPWQSDFSQCNTHWWPSVRPDDVVRPTDTKEGPVPRVKWTRGLRDTPDDTLSSFFPGASDMVQYWNQLGFVAKDSSSNLPAWYEIERTLPEPPN